MKYYSDLLHKLFETSDECDNAEKEYQQKLQSEEQEKKERANAISREKKSLSDTIEATDADLNAAYEEYEHAKEKVREILEKSNREALDILNPAKERVKKAQKARYEAVLAYNQKYGAYDVKYTGAKALSEFNRWNRYFSDFFSHFVF